MVSLGEGSVYVRDLVMVPLGEGSVYVRDLVMVPLGERSMYVREFGYGFLAMASLGERSVYCKKLSYGFHKLPHQSGHSRKLGEIPKMRREALFLYTFDKISACHLNKCFSLISLSYHLSNFQLIYFHSTYLSSYQLLFPFIY